MKFKAGDKARVKADLIVGEKYGDDYFVDDMLPYCGQVVTIDKPACEDFCRIEADWGLTDADTETYWIKEDNGVWIWTNKMLEPEAEALH